MPSISSGKPHHLKSHRSVCCDYQSSDRWAHASWRLVLALLWDCAFRDPSPRQLPSPFPPWLPTATRWLSTPEDVTQAPAPLSLLSQASEVISDATLHALFPELPPGTKTHWRGKVLGDLGARPSRQVPPPGNQLCTFHDAPHLFHFTGFFISVFRWYPPLKEKN